LDHYLVLIPYTEEYSHEAQIRRFRDFEENEGVEIAKMQSLFPKKLKNLILGIAMKACPDDWSRPLKCMKNALDYRTSVRYNVGIGSLLTPVIPSMPFGSSGGNIRKYHVS
jgi:hypothetical protein